MVSAVQQLRLSVLLTSTMQQRGSAIASRLIHRSTVHIGPVCLVCRPGLAGWRGLLTPEVAAEFKHQLIAFEEVPPA